MLLFWMFVRFLYLLKVNSCVFSPAQSPLRLVYACCFVWFKQPCVHGAEYIKCAPERRCGIILSNRYTLSEICCVVCVSSRQHDNNLGSKTSCGVSWTTVSDFLKPALGFRLTWWNHLKTVFSSRQQNSFKMWTYIHVKKETITCSTVKLLLCLFMCSVHV